MIKEQPEWKVYNVKGVVQLKNDYTLTGFYVSRLSRLGVWVEDADYSRNGQFRFRTVIGAADPEDALKSLHDYISVAVSRSGYDVIEYAVEERQRRKVRKKV